MKPRGLAVDFFRRLLFSTLFILCASPAFAQFNDGSGDPFGDEAGRPDSLGGFAACCIAGECIENFPVDVCLATGGEPQPAGVSCADEPCVASLLGGCCTADLCCTELEEAACIASGGRFQGVGTSCISGQSSVICPVVGRCCLDDGTCGDTITIEECDSAGGSWGGYGTVCGQEACGGACCLIDGTCIPDQSRESCATAGGLHQGDDSACTAEDCRTQVARGVGLNSPNGEEWMVQVPQFDNNGGLFELTGAELEIRSKVVAKLQLLNVSSEPIDTSVPYNVEFRLVNGPCGIGFPETTLLDETGIEACATNPLPAGASCDYGCGRVYDRVDGDLRLELPESCFDDLIGAGQFEVGFEGDNDFAAPPGGSLFVVGPNVGQAEVWVSYSFNYVGGACCLCDGTCFDTLEEDCVAQGGVFSGAGTLCSQKTCTPRGRCCLPCPNDEGALCLDDVTDGFCRGVGGSWIECGTCDMDPCPIDDCNGNGLPDDCEDLTDCNGNGEPDECESFDDCNGNSIPDECELDGNDCDSNGIPDDCQPDCDGDNLPDACEVDCNSDGTPDDCQDLADCDSNGVPDVCEPLEDCNGNSVPDRCEISGNDCDGNGIPDECDPDCDGDGLPDACEVDCNADGTPDDCQDLADCDANGTPDVCEPSEDCNGNSIPDRCELNGNDCDSNGIPDECDPDCDSDGIPDACEKDCNGDGVADDCQGLEDCNGNGTPDVCENINDCDGNGIPDECQADCDTNGVPDACEADCDANGTPDACEPFDDCNGSGVPDRCELDGNDCDANGVPDECQEDCDSDGIPDACEDSGDCNANGIPDDCEGLPDCDSNGNPDECEPSEDCNGNGLPDRCETEGNDCDANGIPDDCESDCDSDGVTDACEVDCNADGTPDDCQDLADCDQNGTPDVCEPSEDCNGSGIPDRCELDGNDCNGNGIPDECDLEGNDCDANGVPDGCQTDCDSDGLIDVCEVDCNADGTPDDCQSLADCDANGTPDICEPSEDCNGSGIPDRCEIDGNDCNLNGIPDECDLQENDCDSNGIPDDCQIDCDDDGTPDACEVDCNDNGQPDDCDIAEGSSEDCDGNGQPDECEPQGSCCLGESCVIAIEACCLSLGGVYGGDDTSCTPNPCETDDEPTRGDAGLKGSLLVFPDVVVERDSNGDVRLDTLIQISNDHPNAVQLHMYLVDGAGNCVFLDQTIVLTGNQPTWWRASDGDRLGGSVAPFGALYPNGLGMEEPDGSFLARGFLVVVATDSEFRPIRHNHLSGAAVVVDEMSASEYSAMAWPVVDASVPQGGIVGDGSGTLNLDGVDYASTANRLLLGFEPVQGMIDHEVVLLGMDLDLRHSSAAVPASTKAEWEIWNANEVKFSGTGRCIRCWDATWLSDYNQPNHFLASTLQTEVAKGRLDTEASAQCDSGDGLLAAPALVGVVHRELSFGTTRMVMTQTGWQPSTIRFDQLELPEEAGSMLRDLGRLLNRP